jgi:murein DD-endopeptidase MepM/ murein hydrolase activator NlpD
VSGNDQVPSLAVTDGTVIRVSGVLTSTFSPRLHLILIIVRIDKGVDWAVPASTPIPVSFNGEIVF